MGYRSDVSIAFYTLDQDKLPLSAIKLWFDENYPDPKEADEVKVGKDYILVRYLGWKWYESYPEVQAVAAAMRLFDKTFDTDNPNSHAAREYVRLGEESNDVEEDRSDYHNYRLAVHRYAQFD